jgi:hypothetical protein
MYGKGFVFRVIGALLLVGLMVAGGFMAYQAGVAQGVAEAPVVATAISQAADNGAGAPLGYGHGYGYGHPYGFGRHHFGFFPFGICGSILFVFFFFGLLRMIFFRPWHAGWGHHGHWGRHWEGGAPPMFDEWHKRAHKVPEGGGEAPPSDNSPERSN